ncbi:MAG TPA: hypothetical protein VHR41_04555 [Gemmatimonadales bacterium]|nr:hypothetical protein [Gemmatimonadales bacterium]
MFVAKRRFDPGAGERWMRYIAWSGLTQLSEVVSLDEILCPTVPETLTAADWEHNVHADYQTSYFRSLPYLRQRVAGEPDLNLLAVLQNPSAAELERTLLPGFRFVGFDLLDVHGDVSALTNCGGYDELFAGGELSDQGLLSDLERAYEIQRGLRALIPQSHADCDVWGVWRQGEARWGKVGQGD